MSDEIQDYIARIRRRDFTLAEIVPFFKQYTDAELAEMIDCLLAHPDVVRDVLLGWNRLTDETGIKLARYVAASSTIECLSLHNNQFGEATYLAMTAALRVNTSLRCLYLNGNEAKYKTHIDTTFINAIRLNPNRPVGSVWCLSTFKNDFDRLRAAAEEQGHPTLQMILNNHLELTSIRSIRR